MTSPTSAHSTSIVPPSIFDEFVDALLAQVKWGGTVGTGTTLTYSFPWLNGNSALFSGYNGAAYSSLRENSANFHYALDAEEQAAVRSALQKWSAVANVVFTEVSDTPANAGDLRFGWTSATQTTVTGQAAWGWAGYPNGSWPSGGDVWISTQASGFTDPDWSVGSGNYASLLHEIGHALGLKHTFEGSPTLAYGLDNKKYSVMSYTNEDSLFVWLQHNANGTVSANSFHVMPDTPMLLDILAIQYIYGPNLSWRTGDDTYTFDPAVPFLRTIWDAGGNDTISVGNFAQGCLVDLRDGYYSTITIRSDSTAGYNWGSSPPAPTYDDTPNLAIAFNCIIENAVGGQGWDVLIGNDVANGLDGGSGDDALYGGAGNDVFDWNSGRRAGADDFYGGPGDDVYVVDSLGDAVIEYAGEGSDRIWASFSYSLANLANVEGLFGYGSASLNLTGNGLGNLFGGSTGNDVFNGGAGIDMAVYDGNRSGYTIRKSATGFTVTGAGDGQDTLVGVERVAFSDVNVALDVDGNAGQAYRLYQAAFNRTPDIGGLGFQMRALDDGWALTQIAQNFIDSPEFRATYGSVNNAQFVTLLYQNVLHRAPDADGLAYHVERLNTVPRSFVLVGFSESPENQAALIGVIQNGMAYTV